MPNNKSMPMLKKKEQNIFKLNWPTLFPSHWHLVDLSHKGFMAWIFVISDQTMTSLGNAKQQKKKRMK